MSSMPEPQKSGMRVALEYTGIPASWLSKRPKLPSRNWLIFIGVTSSITGYYIYDRRECRRIRQEYIDKVKFMGEEISEDHQSLPRKVMVYGARWPGDQDYEISVKYFKKYVKPILVAAAVDFEIVNGKRHGDIAARIESEVKARRRIDVGLDQYKYPEGLPPGHPNYSLEEKRKRELEGGIVLLGRPTFKEFMAGMVNGWTGSLEKVDHEELLAQELDQDGRFDEPLDPMDELEKTSHVPGTPLTFSPIFSPPQSAPTPQQPIAVSPEQDASPSTWPALPPLLLVSFTNLIGFKQMPRMIWEWFNARDKVRQGAEDGYRLVMNQTRPILPPTSAQQLGDLDFDAHTERFYRAGVDSIMGDIDAGRKKYYESLAEKLKIARELSRGTREPTQLEMDKPPKTEVELRSERMTKEQRWRGDAKGWEILRPEAPVAWDPRLEGTKVFVESKDESA